MSHSNGMTQRQVFDRFTAHAGYVGDLHTKDGVKSLYRIYYRGDELYSDDTLQLRLAFENLFFRAPNGLYYHSEEDAADELSSNS